MIIKHNLAGLDEGLREFTEKQLPFIMSRSMNDALYPTRRQLQMVMASPTGIIQGGATGFTKSRLRYKKSNKNDLHVSMHFLDEAAYMQEIMYGGRKSAKGKKLKEPAKGDFGNLNKYGNFSKTYLDKIFTHANAAAGAKWQSITGRNHKTKIMKGHMGIRYGVSKGGTYGIWDWNQISKKTGKKPRLLIYLGRKSRDQRATAKKLPEIAQSIYEGRMRKVLPRFITKSLQESFQHRLRKLR